MYPKLELRYNFYITLTLSDMTFDFICKSYVNFHILNFLLLEYISLWNFQLLAMGKWKSVFMLSVCYEKPILVILCQKCSLNL